MTNIIGCDPDTVHVGQHVTAVTEQQLGDPTPLLRFTPASS
jgi:hypothetical protein